MGGIFILLGDEGRTGTDRKVGGVNFSSVGGQRKGDEEEEGNHLSEEGKGETNCRPLFEGHWW